MNGAFAAACAVATVAVAGFSFAYEMRRDALVADMVSKGADPIAAACALGALRATTPPCLTAAAKGK